MLMADLFSAPPSYENNIGKHPGRLSENSARSEDCEKLRIKISASKENSGAI